MPCDVGVGLVGVIVDNTLLVLCVQKLCISGAESRKVPRQLVFVNGRPRALERLLRRLSSSVPLNRAFIRIAQVPHVLYGSARAFFVLSFLTGTRSSQVLDRSALVIKVS